MRHAGLLLGRSPNLLCEFRIIGSVSDNSRSRSNVSSAEMDFVGRFGTTGVSSMPQDNSYRRTPNRPNSRSSIAMSTSRISRTVLIPSFSSLAPVTFPTPGKRFTEAEARYAGVLAAAYRLPFTGELVLCVEAAWFLDEVRYPLRANPIDKEPRKRLIYVKSEKLFLSCRLYGGERGIRTPDTR